MLASANQQLPVLLSVLLTIAIAWYLARLVWLLVPTDPTVAIPAAAPASRPATSAYTPDLSHTGIVDSHLFGESSAADAGPVATDAINAPETRLNLKLHGAIMSNDSKKAHAIISEDGKDSNVYFIGDMIPGGAKLHEVQAEQVVLNRGGVLEVLKLPELAKGGVIAGKTTNQAASRRRSFGPRTVRDTLGADGNSGEVRFTDVVRPQPFMPNGELKGYRIYPGRDRKRFAALGLRPGDLVTDINGVALNNVTEGMELFQTLGDATQITVTLERGGQVQVLNLDTSQITLKDERR